MPLSEQEEVELLELLEQEERERVSPVIEQFRQPADVKCICSGRGGGAKSRGISSLLVQKLNEKSLRWFCGRLIQKSLEESSFSLILDQIERLEYSDWEAVPSSSKIINRRNGSYFYFAGIRDEKTAKNLKGLEDYDGAWIDEAEDITAEVWDILLPSFRKENSEVWISFNRNKEADAAYKMFYIDKPPNTIALTARPGKLDNPWFPEKLQRKLEHDYKTRPAIAEHIWGGKPKQQGFNSVMSRVAVRAAMNRKIEPVGQFVVGVDVARFGDDDSVMYMRQGFKVTKWEQYHGLDTQTLATKIWDFVGSDPSIKIIIDDTGVGGGVTDRLRVLGAKVHPVNFGSGATDKDKYGDIITEMWFEFPVEDADIPDDDELMDELTERLYDYDKREIKKVESKKEFKKRFGKSPDKADALLLCFMTGTELIMSDSARSALANRRNR